MRRQTVRSGRIRQGRRGLRTVGVPVAAVVLFLAVPWPGSPPNPSDSPLERSAAAERSRQSTAHHVRAEATLPARAWRRRVRRFVHGIVAPPRADTGGARARPGRRDYLSGTGRLVVVPGSSEVLGRGPVRRFMVEVEGGLGVDRAAFAGVVERVLSDPRSWGGSGSEGFRRVSHGPASFRVTLASPHTTDGLCVPLQTNGSFSCYMGGRAVLNAWRWHQGANAYAGRLQAYRTYVVNHEVGHALGEGHVGCPAAGHEAPVMMQQTKGVAPCGANAWPYPSGHR
jgi:plasmid stabilization system protein ParE